MTQSIDVQHLQKNKRNKTYEGEKEDRISQLPIEILHHILPFIPLECAARNSILSNRWKEIWESMWANTTTLDFGREFERGKSPSHVSRAINRLLQIHRANSVEIFRLYINPMRSKRFLPEIRTWIEFAVGKRVKELDLDFKFLTARLGERPPCVFYCDSLTILKLTGCKFNVPSDFRGFSSLKTLHLSCVRIAPSVLDGMLLKCSVLEELSLIWCHGIPSLELSAIDSKIKSFTLIGVRRWDNVGSFLPKLANLRILTIQSLSALGYKNAPGNLPIVLSNLRKLRLEGCDSHDLSGIYALLTNWNFPYLEKLTIQWDLPYCISMVDEMEQPPGCVLHRLKTIKMKRFYGIHMQMHMVKFLLEKAVVLKTMVLVAPKAGSKGYIKETCGSHEVTS